MMTTPCRHQWLLVKAGSGPGPGIRVLRCTRCARLLTGRWSGTQRRRELRESR